MKTIQLLQTAALLSIAVGSDHTNHLRRNLQLQNVTCAPNETPCHVETDVVVACAPEGEMCPCYFNERQCHSDKFGDYCDTVCCEWGTQERCHSPSLDDPGMAEVFCANIAEGGCPCPTGETRCGTMETDGGFTGACMAICCDDDNGAQQTCYDEDYNPSYCALVETGGCPCPEGKVRCGGTEDWAGYCTEVCCDDLEETCFDGFGRSSCSKISMGGCLSNTSYEFWDASFRLSSTILGKGTGSQVSYYSDIVERKKKLLGSSEGMIKKLEAEEAALFHAIRRRERGSRVKVEEITSIS